MASPRNITLTDSDKLTGGRVATLLKGDSLVASCQAGFGRGVVLNHEWAVSGRRVRVVTTVIRGGFADGIGVQCRGRRT